jgi:hypothetical protein
LVRHRPPSWVNESEKQPHRPHVTLTVLPHTMRPVASRSGIGGGGCRFGEGGGAFDGSAPSLCRAQRGGSTMWSLCAGGPAEEDDAAPVGTGEGAEGGAAVADGYADSSYRPGRALARELIDEAAMSPGGQVELPRGVSRSAYSVHTAKVVGAPGSSGSGPTLSSFTSSTFGRRGLGAGDTEESAHQAEVLGEELKKEGNALYNEGQVEAAELVYTEALKVSDSGGGGRGRWRAARCVYCAPSTVKEGFRTKARSKPRQGNLTRRRPDSTSPFPCCFQYSPKNHVIYSNRSMCYGRLGKYAVRVF